MKFWYFILLGAAVSVCAAGFEEELAAIGKMNFSRDLHLQTALVKKRRPAAVILPGKTDPRCAEIINRAVRERCGTVLPVVTQLPESGNVIVLGNRDRNGVMEDLYNRHYTLLDARYPGKDGAVARSLHNPFGDKRNYLLVGGSDPAGDLLAAQLLARRIASLPAGESLTLGYFADLQYGRDVRFPENVRDAVPANQTPGGHAFGWNSLSKSLALFYVTGDTRYAEEFLRYAFPDKATSEELLKNDGAFGVGNMKNPLGEPYHYNGYYQTLYWDLVEEHPFFTPEIRAKVTAKLYESLLRRKWNGDKGIYKTFKDREDLPRLKGRHWLAEAVQVYSIARYFDKHYDFPLAADAMKIARKYFVTLDQYAAINAGSLAWYASFLQPAVHFALLDRGGKAKELAVFRTYVGNLMLLANGKKGDWSLADTSYQLMNIFGYLAQDQAPLTQAEMIVPAGTGVLLGQSYTPAVKYEKDFFRTGDGTWNCAAFDSRGMPEWKPPFAREKVVEWLNYRKLGPGGRDDFALVDAKFESGRNAFHNFAMIEFYLQGSPLLLGYSNQVMVYPNGLAKSELPLYTEVICKGRTGNTGYLQGKVANFNGCEWKRTFVMRDHRFLLAVDEFKPLDPEGTQFIDVDNPFQFPAAAWFSIGEYGFGLRSPDKKDWTIDCSEEALLKKMEVSGGMLNAGNSAAVFAVTGPGKGFRMASVLYPGKNDGRPSAARQGDLIALRFPEKAMLRLLPEGGFWLQEKTGNFAFHVKEIPGIFSASGPVSAEWDGAILWLCADAETQVQMADGRVLNLSAGKTLSVKCSGKPVQLDEEKSAAILQAKKRRSVIVSAPELTKIATVPVSGIGVDCMVELNGEKLLAAATGKKLYLLDTAGKIRREYAVPSPIGSFAYFAEKQQFIIGSRDEIVRAIGLDGREVWQFRSQMSDETQWQGQWWAKCSIPGVRGITVARLANGKTFLVIGGASVVEVLSPEGKLLVRRFMPWGTYKKCTVREKDFLCWGYMVSHPNVYSFNEELKRSYMSLETDINGVWMGGFGFGYNGRSALEYTQLKPDGQKVLVGTFNGTMNRVMIWNAKGKVLHEAALGFGIRAFGAPFGAPELRTTNVRGFALPDFRKDGHKKVAVGFIRDYVALFDSSLKPEWLVRLPAAPRLLAAVPGPAGDRLAAVCDDGRLYILDEKGRITAQAEITPRATMLTGWDDTLFVSSEKGGVTLFRLP